MVDRPPQKKWIFGGARKEAPAKTIILVSCNECKSPRGTHVGKLWLCGDAECKNSREKRLARGETPSTWRNCSDAQT